MPTCSRSSKSAPPPEGRVCRVCRVFINSLEYLSQVQAHQVVLPPQLQDVYQEVEKEAQALDEVVEDQASLAQALVQACQDGRQVERLVAQEVQAHKVLLAPLHAQAQQELVEGSPQAQYRVVEAQAPLAQALEHEEQVLWKVSQVLEEKVRKRRSLFEACPRSPRHRRGLSPCVSTPRCC